ncbi:16454_t:CDS:2 [Dentiscutata erythropus]|uniref:protein disulfide-isomerase n=1 Tax=Dentiscutata erythropus TaxID=1348616 RepID=A0A9N8V8E1_9GLOM|nr:16454_t:CDS:2 [Dentiscutata erythropus]
MVSYTVKTEISSYAHKTQGASALYDSNSPVILLSENNWAEEVLYTEKVVVVEFFAPWCGHCKNLAPEYIKAAENLKGLVKVAAVNCDDEANRRICGSYDVQGFPTIKLFPSKPIEDENVVGKFTKKPKDYLGARTAKAIVDYALPEIPSFVHTISNSYSISRALTMDEFFSKENDTISKVVLFTNKDQTTPLYKALSCEFHNRLIFGEVKEKESAIAEKFGVNKFPKLFVIPKESNEAIEFKVDPEIYEITTQSELESQCLSKPIGLCVFSFLILEPEYPESVADHSNNLEILRKVKKKFHDQSSVDKKLSLRFFWFNALSKGAKKLIKDFKLSDMFPNLMILNPNRKVYRPHIGPFDEEGVVKFLNDIAKGRGSSYEYGFDVFIDEKIEKKDDKKKDEKEDDEKKVEKKDDEKKVEKKDDDEKVEKKDDEKKDDEKKDDEKKVEKRDDEKKDDEKKTEEEKKCGIDELGKDGVCSGGTHKTESKSDEKDKPKDHDEL